MTHKHNYQVSKRYAPGHFMETCAVPGCGKQRRVTVTATGKIIKYIDTGKTVKRSG